MWHIGCTPIFTFLVREISVSRPLYLPRSHDQARQRSQDLSDNLQTMRGIDSPSDLPLGSPLPPNDVHGVGVHLPEWRDTVGWAARDRRVVDAMRTGYPRFFVPRVVDKLAERIIELCRGMSNWTSIAPDGKVSAIIFPTRRHAEIFLPFLARNASPGELRGVHGITLQWEGSISPLKLQDSDGGSLKSSQDDPDVSPYRKEISAVLYPSTLYTLAKAFWQHTGFGLSSRQATYWLENSPLCGNPDGKSDQNHCAKYIEPNPGTVKQIIRGRIADGQSSDVRVDEGNVILYPTGMTAITETASAIKRLRTTNNKRQPTAAVFGFTYVDTYKTLTRVLNFNTSLYKYNELDKLEHQLTNGLTLDALFTEFPGNPLLQSPDLSRLHALSTKHNFILVVDDTVGTYINVNLLRSCDVICTSLTKMFSGGCNVMGGAVTLSPESPHHADLSSLREEHKDSTWFPEDVFTMEENSRDFRERVLRANTNAELVIDLLRNHPAIEEVYYPKGSPTQGIYDQFRLEEGGYGFLLSIKFRTPAKAMAFYDALDVAKGPSLGTNFTLCCAYTLLAHYSELEWAAEYGVVEHLVRISVGLEDEEWLRLRVDKALCAAEECRG